MGFIEVYRGILRYETGIYPTIPSFIDRLLYLCSVHNITFYSNIKCRYTQSFSPKNRSPHGLRWRLFSFAVIELCQAAFAGFPEAVVQVDAGLMHGPADHIVADIPGAR